MINSYIKILYHKSMFKISNYKKYSILISIIKYIEIKDLIFFIFIQSLFFIIINIFNFNFIKFIISKILNYYQDLFKIFFKKELKSLLFYQNYLNYYISLKKNIKSIFDF